METKTMNRAYKAAKCDEVTKSLAASIHAVYDRAARECWPHSRIMEQLALLDRSRLRATDSLYLQGVSDTLYKLHWSNLVYTYVVNGKRLSIESEEYKAVSPQYVSEHCAGTGAYAYRCDLSKLF